ncbi:hypothetical protein GALMADRAFT_144750 [Galerina marginata CBS 339.88]|uniref:Uncharacterized protein n=1 Tax=Galerina marginata (strain CBS 339.88) TaxID=685588 RepID=A0A067SHW3_GALM3|nr:hypothetical protein GALMADRAFT_144750 [Galerina marginata CBS 339.88]
MSIPFESILTNTFGAYTIATFASAILLGVTCFQAWHYFNTYSDPPIINYTVAALVALEMLHLAVSIHALYFYLITNYLNPLALLQNVWSINVYSLVILPLPWTMLTDYTKDYIGHHRNDYVASASFLCDADISCGKKKFIPFAIAVVSLIHCAVGWAVVAILFRERLTSQLPGLPETLAKALLAAAVAIDAVIAYTLSYYLHTNRSGIKQ